jgi:hypothetical protein
VERAASQEMIEVGGYCTRSPQLPPGACWRAPAAARLLLPGLARTSGIPNGRPSFTCLPLTALLPLLTALHTLLCPELWVFLSWPRWQAAPVLCAPVPCASTKHHWRRACCTGELASVMLLSITPAADEAKHMKRVKRRGLSCSGCGCWQGLGGGTAPRFSHPQQAT